MVTTSFAQGIYKEQPKNAKQQTLLNDLTAEGLIDKQNNEQIAEWILRQLNQQGKQITDPWLVDQVSLLLNSVNAQARNQAPVSCVIMDDTTLNAFATPGGLVAVNSGLIMRAKRVDELVAVLAHEVAHISQRHFNRRVDNRNTDRLIQLGGLIVSAIVAKKNNQAAQAIAMGSQAYVIDKKLAFSRSQEKEADRIGMKIMQTAGYDPSAMADFFTSMYATNKTLGYVPQFLLTHPLTQHRISDATQHANQLSFLPRYDHAFLQAQFYHIKWRLYALSSNPNIARILAVAKHKNSEQLAAKLALVTVYIRQSQFKKAQRLLNGLALDKANHVLLTLHQSNLWLQTNHIDKAEKLLARANKIHPNTRAIILMHANVLRLQNKHTDAIKQLQPLIRKNKRDLPTWRLLAQTASEMPLNHINQIKALRYLAEVKFWQNDIDNAIKALNRAKILATKHPSHLAKIKKRTREMTTALAFQS